MSNSYVSNSIMSIPDIECKSSSDDLINHIVFVIDASGSMSSLKEDVINVFDSQVQYLSVRSQELNQETRVSVYMFSDKVECVAYDKDVMRLPSLKDRYKTGGGTALLDGMMRTFTDLEKTAQLYGDHAFLVYVITDGEDTCSKNKSVNMSKRLMSMPNNWTVAVLVPNQVGVFEAKKFGILPNNIQIWDTNKEGIAKAGDNIKIATEMFLNNRVKGISGTQNLFKIDMSAVTEAEVQQNLNEIDSATYNIYVAADNISIKEFVETSTGQKLNTVKPFYQLSKKELIQKYKRVYIRDKNNGKVYGGNNARDLLKIPRDTDVDVKPADHSIFDIFVESTSVNRKILAGTSVLVEK
jgi:hypothetical protein